jgi:3-oxoacyl-[acyl-carrier protein] reductase
MDLGLEGRTAIVTGGSLGIGRAVVLELAAEGANVVCVARNQGNLDETVALGEGSPGKIHAIRADCATPAVPGDVVAETASTFGSVDILVNNVGTGVFGRDWSTDDETWDATMNVNFYSAVRFAREAIPHMQQSEWGRILNISSVSGHSGFPQMGDYNASKAAMIMWSKTLSRELAPHITVNSICPAAIDTPLWDDLASQLTGVTADTPEGVKQKNAESVALGRYGEANEVSGLCAFLVSERASFITGASYNVDGGWSMFAF